MTGTGEKKWVPTTRSGRVVAAAMSVMGMAEVLDASTTSGRASRSRSAKTARLTSSVSYTASTTRSACATTPRSVVQAMRPSAAAASSAVILSRPTERR
jgi:hypothetical protein